MRVAGLWALVVGMRWLAPTQVELRQLHVSRSRDLDVFRGAHYHRDFVTGAFGQRGFVGARESVGGSFVECFLNDAVTKSLWGLGQHHARARNRRFDDGALRRALDLLYRVDGRQSGDGGAVFCCGCDHFFNDLRVHQRPHRIVHQHNVVGSGCDYIQSVLHRFLSVLAAHHELDFFLQQIFRFTGQPLAKWIDLIFPEGDPDFADFLDRGKLPHGVNENRSAGEFSELFRGMELSCLRVLGAGHRSHARPESGSRNNDNHLHGGLKVYEAATWTSNPTPPRSPLNQMWSHPERSRLSGGERDLTATNLEGYSECSVGPDHATPRILATPPILRRSLRLAPRRQRRPS